jgi:hypothetical protein
MYQIWAAVEARLKNALTPLSNTTQESEVKPQGHGYKLPERPQKARWPESLSAKVDVSNLGGGRGPSWFTNMPGLPNAIHALTPLPNTTQESEVKPQGHGYKLPERPQKARLSPTPLGSLIASDRDLGGLDLKFRPLLRRVLSQSCLLWLLSVDIPDVQMERYSVMFSNVVNKNQKPSLLARVQVILRSPIPVHG